MNGPRSHYAEIKCSACGVVVAYVSVAAMRRILPISSESADALQRRITEVENAAALRCPTCADPES